MKATIIMILLLGNSEAFQIKPVTSKKFPKISYTKIYDISYRAPIRIRRKQPTTFTIVNQIFNHFKNYTDQVYAMGSFPLSFTFPNLINETLTN